MSSSAATSSRARLAALSRYRSVDDPALATARARLAEDKLIAAVERALASAPPLRPEVRERIVSLLSTAGASV